MSKCNTNGCLKRTANSYLLHEKYENREENNACQNAAPLEENLESRRVLNEKFQFELTVKDQLIYYITEGTKEVLKRSRTS